MMKRVWKKLTWWCSHEVTRVTETTGELHIECSLCGERV
ncbi:unnamed protein product [uncultured bacterium]|jgi:hypothetical protein|nr:unnamed protein product [uncultured bacterium]